MRILFHGVLYYAAYNSLRGARPVNSRTGGLRLAVAWPGTGTAVSITDRSRTCVLPGDRQSPVRLIGEFTDPARSRGGGLSAAAGGHPLWPAGHQCTAGATRPAPAATPGAAARRVGRR